MTNGLLTDRNRMEYDGTKGVYTLQLPLKQGAYNYRYLVKDLDGKVKSLDGDKWETGNQYEVSLWKRRPGDRADSLIGVELIQ